MTTKRRRRSPARGGRPVSCMVALSEEEAALLHAAAAREGMSLGAWIGDAAVRVAQQDVKPQTSVGQYMQGLMVLRNELGEARRVLRITGGNLNDVARHANTTGEIHGATMRVLGRVEEAVIHLERLVRLVDLGVGLLRAELTGKPRRRSRRQAEQPDSGPAGDNWEELAEDGVS